MTDTPSSAFPEELLDEEGNAPLDLVAQQLADELFLVEEAKWRAGDMLLSLGEKCPSLRTLASMTGTSFAYLSTLRTVSRIFPEGVRALDQKWQLHRLAAIAPDPEDTLATAIDNGWSTRDLENDLAGRGFLQRRSGTKLCRCADGCCALHREEV